MTARLNFKKIYRQLDFFSRLIVVAVLALILPVLLLPAAKYFGYSEVWEELTKALVVVFIILRFSKSNFKIIGAVSFGFLFAVSESMFYLSNFFQLGDLSLFWQRLLWTAPMHILTTLIILYFSLLNRKLAIVGLIVGIVIHITFNVFVSTS